VPRIAKGDRWTKKLKKPAKNISCSNATNAARVENCQKINTKNQQNNKKIVLRIDQGGNPAEE
jgi:hypothetical protein